MKIKKITNAVGLVMAGSMIAATSAFAQGAAKVEKIEVTGSNIKRADVEGPLPVLVITREEIDRSAVATVGDFVRGLTVNSGGSGNESNISNQSGASGVSLRGLGQKSTLVLINGRRMANHAFARNNQDTFVDLNSIPKGAIERIEVLKDGASAVYGSDAIGGVVNFIMRKDYQGIQFGADTGRRSDGGLNERNVNISGGVGSLAKDKYNIFGVVDYFHRERMLLSDSKWVGDGNYSRYVGGALFNNFLTSSAGTWVSVAPDPAFSPTSLTVQPTGVPGGVRRQAFTTCMGNGFRLNLGAIPAAPFFTTGTICAGSLTPFIVAYPEQTRVGGMARGNFELSGGTNAFFEAQYAQNKTNFISQPQTMTQSSQVFDPATQTARLYNARIPATNPSNPFGRAYQLRYTFFDVGAVQNDIKTDAYRVLGGFNGTAGRWDWDGAIGVSQSKINEKRQNQVDADALQLAIQNGTYNFLAPTPAQTAAIRVSTERNSTSDLAFGDIKATTTIGKLDGGDIGFAMGLDARREKFNDQPDPLTRTGRLLGTGSSITNGSRNVVAAFAEVSAPFTKAVELVAAARADRYSDFGSAVSPKVGLKWSPSKDVLVRMSYNRGFRAPTLVENTQSTTLSLTTLTGLGATGGTAVILRGNPNLKPEKSESSSIGAVWDPIKDLSLSLDWYKIDQRDLISINGAGFIANNAALFPNAIVRDSAGLITTIFDGYVNVARVSVEGLDAEARWVVPSAWGFPGRLQVRSVASYLTNFKQPPARGANLVQYAGNNGLQGSPGRGALPRTKAKLGFDWDYKGFAVSTTSNYISGYRQLNATIIPTTIGSVGSYLTTDLSVSYTYAKKLKFYLSALNLEDRQPPFDPSTFGWDSTLYDLRGRYFRGGFQYTFK